MTAAFEGTLGQAKEWKRGESARAGPEGKAKKICHVVQTYTWRQLQASESGIHGRKEVLAT
jgi:hypothetical protein